ncbi:MAG: hypothetical protein J5U19_14355 [Candidatus Methanoperedens sp.]|nr:hypothetical protein [Candidatus Methanoperedens sp.]
MLEQYAVKVASTVLKGLGVGNDLQLLDPYDSSLFRGFLIICIFFVSSISAGYNDIINPTTHLYAP